MGRAPSLHCIPGHRLPPPHPAAMGFAPSWGEARATRRAPPLLTAPLLPSQLRRFLPLLLPHARRQGAVQPAAHQEGARLQVPLPPHHMGPAVRQPPPGRRVGTGGPQPRCFLLLLLAVPSVFRVSEALVSSPGIALPPSLPGASHAACLHPGKGICSQNSPGSRRGGCAEPSPCLASAVSQGRGGGRARDNFRRRLCPRRTRAAPCRPPPCLLPTPRAGCSWCPGEEPQPRGPPGTPREQVSVGETPPSPSVTFPGRRSSRPAPTPGGGLPMTWGLGAAPGARGTPAASSVGGFWALFWHLEVCWGGCWQH